MMSSVDRMKYKNANEILKLKGYCASSEGFLAVKNAVMASLDDKIKI
jgi:hypothetical protein